ncbi:hypothetical protein [Chromatium okenii]|jgi:hypothetical protein|uniref:Uncharacterized protein n=1 Tax=Chromatium okenii TaxID=61644 RepID=A0A2S7XSI1_9GAMM|nr:hypothetical protein [Chromatium okenii]PQJ96503.1 hypothetical protein CXB77_06580 [Chromatium okenii]
MQNRPLIKTAIPKRRYQIGNYTAALLGEIDSGDHQSYRYILAWVPTGQRDPVLYVCAEHTPPNERADGAYRLRVVNENMTEVLDTGDGWGDLETFAEQALNLGMQMLGLMQARIDRLL